MPGRGGGAPKRNTVSQQLKKQQSARMQARSPSNHNRVHPEDGSGDEPEETLKEPPSSWHHVVRMRVLDASTSRSTKVVSLSGSNRCPVSLVDSPCSVPLLMASGSIVWEDLVLVGSCARARAMGGDALLLLSALHPPLHGPIER